MANAHGSRGWAAETVAAMLVILSVAPGSPAQTFKTLLNFNGTNGSGPLGSLVQGSDGNFYGTTYVGGNMAECDFFGCGTIFRMTPTGVVTTLYSFCPQAGCTDGYMPWDGLVLGSDGNFYGTANGGGANDLGTVFKVTSTGTLTTLYSFDLSAYGPIAGLVQGTDGNFYGTTQFGGPSGDHGAVFKITPQGSFKIIHNFGGTDGSWPYAALVQGTDGNFYGTTETGGTNNDGTVFKITPAGMLTTLHDFNSADGGSPAANLFQVSDGNFYGTTQAGGTYNYGTVFTITSAGTLTTLHSFDYSDGANPFAGLGQGTDGNFYGTTSGGGKNGDGTIFVISPQGVLTTLHSFAGSTEGSAPDAVPFQATNGGFYGTTAALGVYGDGGAWALSVGLAPFARTVPGFGKVGAAVRIFGNHLTGAASVTFNGTSASFTVQSATAIKATVPAGATTGPVQVVTPSGTLTSNVNFQVLP